jgi:prevent-host-death family protein
MQVTATDAKNRLGQVLEHAQREPVVIEKAGRKHSVVVSFEHYQALLASAQPKLLPEQAGARFYARYQAWVDEHNRLTEEAGVFGEAHRPW